MPASIYRITNTITGDFYIGRTNKSVDARWYKHSFDARNNSHYHFHRAIRKYGDDKFVAETIEIIPNIHDAIAREIYWIGILNPPYNMTRGGEGGGMFGKQHSAETKKKMSLARTGRKMSEQSKAKLATWHTGRLLSQESKNKISQAKRNVSIGPMTEEHKAKLSQAMRGRSLSPEHKTKISAARRNSIF